MGGTQKILELIPQLVTIKVLEKVSTKFSGPKSRDFSGPKPGGISHERSFDRLNKKDKQRL